MTEISLPEAILPKITIPKVLVGQQALVTGGSSGIGKAIATALGLAGANVLVNYYSDQDEAEETVLEIKKHSVDSYCFKADVSKRHQVESMFKSANERFGTIDILVSNAGIQKDAPFHAMKVEEWEQVINVNLTGQFHCCQLAVQEFKKRGVKENISVAAGKILCVSSVHEFIPWARHVNYAASKGGVMQMMKSLAQEVAPHRIRVNSIAPGAIRTPINKSSWSTEEAYKKLLKVIPYNRIGETQDIASVAVFLASDQSDYINGTSIVVDGGMSLYPSFAPDDLR